MIKMLELDIKKLDEYIEYLDKRKFKNKARELKQIKEDLLSNLKKIEIELKKTLKQKEF